MIDWDDVYCVPTILTRRPPVWRWDFSDDTESCCLPERFDGGADLLPVERYTPAGVISAQAGYEELEEIKSSTPHYQISSEDYDLKRYFEEQFVKGLTSIYPDMRQEDYQDQAFGKGRWIRRLARFAIHGASDTQDLERFERLAEEWKNETRD